MHWRRLGRAALAVFGAFPARALALGQASDLGARIDRAVEQTAPRIVE